MKKSVKILISILCLCPILLLTACGTTTYYTISVAYSDSYLGSATGAYSNDTQVEGTSLVLTARENYPSTNPFICWIKDNSRVVSTDRTLSLTYNSQTAGRYTVVFEESSPNGMMYVALNEIQFEEFYNVSTINFSLKYARTVSGSDVYVELENGTFSPSDASYSGAKQNVLYFGTATNSYQYRLRLDLVVTDTTGVETTYSLNYNDLLSNTSFNNQSTFSAVLTDGVTGGSVTLSFAKLSTSLFS